MDMRSIIGYGTKVVLEVARDMRIWMYFGVFRNHVCRRKTGSEKKEETEHIKNAQQKKEKVGERTVSCQRNFDFSVLSLSL